MLNGQPTASTSLEDWETIAPEPVPLAEVVIFGNGKDAGLTISLTDGRRLSMGAGNVTVLADGAVNVQFQRVDDLDVKIRYSGSGLEARSVRVRYGSRDWQDEFRADLREWLSNGVADDLGYSVDAEIVLAVADR